MSHEKAIFDGVRTRLGVRKSREMTLRIHRLENNEYWKDRSSPQTSDTISPIIPVTWVPHRWLLETPYRSKSVLRSMRPESSAATLTDDSSVHVRSPVFDPHRDEDLVKAISIVWRSANLRERESLVTTLEAVTSADEVRAVIDDLDIGEVLRKLGRELSKEAVNPESDDLIKQLERTRGGAADRTGRPAGALGGADQGTVWYRGSSVRGPGASCSRVGGASWRSSWRPQWRPGLVARPMDRALSRVGRQGRHAQFLESLWIKGFLGLPAGFLFGRHWVYIHRPQPHPPGHGIGNCFGCQCV